MVFFIWSATKKRAVSVPQVSLEDGWVGVRVLAAKTSKRIVEEMEGPIDGALSQGNIPCDVILRKNGKLYFREIEEDRLKRLDKLWWVGVSVSGERFYSD